MGFSPWGNGFAFHTLILRAQNPTVTERLKTCWVVDLGLLAYAPACELQRRLVQARKAGEIPDTLLFCQHPHTITLGRNGNLENLRASNHLLRQMNVEFHPTDRGGDVTYHGPGQIVGYPILDLTAHRRDVRWYVEQLEEAMIRATAGFGLAAHRSAANHGIWLDSPSSAPMPAPNNEEKLAALGVHLSRWVTSHGFAYNVSTDLRYFDLIVPCGLAGKRASSLERALGRSVSLAEVRGRIAKHFAEVFALTLVPVSPRELEASLLAAEEKRSNLSAAAPVEITSLKGSEA
jgi:lipoyl(octanoyl) transferase